MKSALWTSWEREGGYIGSFIGRGCCGSQASTNAQRDWLFRRRSDHHDVPLEVVLLPSVTSQQRPDESIYQFTAFDFSD